MSAELAAKYGDVLIKCPMPEQANLAPERLGDFIQTEVGKRVLGDSLGNVQVLLDTGMGEEQALTIALGAVLVRDEEGRMLRAPSPDQEPALAGSQSVDSKKK